MTLEDSRKNEMAMDHKSPQNITLVLSLWVNLYAKATEPLAAKAHSEA